MDTRPIDSDSAHGAESSTMIGGSDLGARLHWMIHGVHHDHPNDPMRLVMPPSASVPLALAFYALFWAVLGADSATAFGAGFLTGYLAYDMVHYAVHHHRPRTRVGRRLRELHMRHHFQDDERGFGVSAPYWDRVFGTAPGPRSRPEPESTRFPRRLDTVAIRQSSIGREPGGSPHGYAADRL